MQAVEVRGCAGVRERMLGEMEMEVSCRGAEESVFSRVIACTVVDKMVVVMVIGDGCVMMMLWCGDEMRRGEESGEVVMVLELIACFLVRCSWGLADHDDGISSM